MNFNFSPSLKTSKLQTRLSQTSAPQRERAAAPRTENTLAAASFIQPRESSSQALVSLRPAPARPESSSALHARGQRTPWYLHVSTTTFLQWLQKQTAAWELQAARLLSTKKLSLAVAQLPRAEAFDRYFSLLRAPGGASTHEHRQALWALATPDLFHFTKVMEQTLEMNFSSPALVESLATLLSRLSGGELPVSAAAARKTLRHLLLRHHPDKLEWTKFSSEFDLDALQSIQKLLNVTLSALRRADLNEQLFAVNQRENARLSLRSYGEPLQRTTLFYGCLLGALWYAVSPLATKVAGVFEF